MTGPFRPPRLVRKSASGQCCTHREWSEAAAVAVADHAVRLLVWAALSIVVAAIRSAVMISTPEVMAR